MAKFSLWKLCVFLHFCIVFVNSECILNFPADRWSTPTYEKTFGSRKISIPFLNGYVRLEDGDDITGTCATHFNAFNYIYKYEDNPSDIYDPYGRMRASRRMEQLTDTRTVKDMRSISLICEDGTLKYEENKLATAQLSCAPLEWSIYEAETPFPWCASTAGSYILGTKSLSENLNLAAACFDVENTSLLNVRYFAGPRSAMLNYNDLLSLMPEDMKEMSLAVEIKHFDTTLSHLRDGALVSLPNSNKQRNLWLQLARYEQHSLIQGGAYAEYFTRFGLFLDTIWWPNLRLGNWRCFLDALNERAKSKSYNLYAGTSGIVNMPLDNKCAQSDMKELRLGAMNRTVPAYIWTYVQAADKSEEFVIVSYNSPFYEFFPRENVIFCQDICEQIEWLNDIRSTFRYATMGVTFCCSLKEVREGDLLDGFPLKEELRVATTTTAEPFTSTPNSDSTTTLAYNQENTTVPPSVYFYRNQVDNSQDNADEEDYDG